MKKSKNFGFLASTALLGVVTLALPIFFTSCSYTLPISLELEVGKSANTPVSLNLDWNDSKTCYNGTITSFANIKNNAKDVSATAQNFNVKIVRDESAALKGIKETLALIPNASNPTQCDTTIELYAEQSQIDKYLGTHILSIRWDISLPNADKHIATANGAFVCYLALSLPDNMPI
ncbi:MAG: hypothetical protein LBD63_00825 [Mycoplasmataceae bacterium]|nr:hypothetical protein [Mycoplasmataceae bacterium]